MLKKIIAGAMLALPLVVTSVPTKASALEAIINPHVQNSASAPVLIARAHRRRWIPAHWEGRGRHRHRVAGHWQNY